MIGFAGFMNANLYTRIDILTCGALDVAVNAIDTARSASQ